MYHPLAWGFPDTSKIVTPNPGEPLGAEHEDFLELKWFRTEQDVDFLYTLRLRCFPESTFQALSLGKIPAFIQEYIDIHKDTLEEEEEEDHPAGNAGNAGNGGV
ncbi:RNA 3'-terminal-phosphate cyclase (ATP) [Durusdinium trenchii]|uniref:RNA 3'-terminal-phosphate cyclase (ATP) n=1 Tax=Durusdinium trenchii TaxID=1381693 RepID=A0ABP0QHR9_9DINO